MSNDEKAPLFDTDASAVIDRDKLLAEKAVAEAIVGAGGLEKAPLFDTDASAVVDRDKLLAEKAVAEAIVGAGGLRQRGVKKHSGPTVFDDSDPRFNPPTPSPWTRAALLLFLGLLFYYAFTMRMAISHAIANPPTPSMPEPPATTTPRDGPTGARQPQILRAPGGVH